MKTVESYMVKTKIMDVFPSAITSEGEIRTAEKGHFFYLVWIESEFASKPAEEPFSRN